MTVNFDDILASVAARIAHNREQDFIEHSTRARIANVAMIEPMRFKLASAALAHAMKDSRGDFFRIHPADANNGHTAFAERRRNRGYGGFLVHEATNLNNSEAEGNQLA